MGAKKCMVVFCENRGRIPGIKYFRLTAARRDPWLRALGRNPNAENLTDGNRICSQHFAKDDIIVKRGQICLKLGAIPSKRLVNHGLLDPVEVVEVTCPWTSTGTIHNQQKKTVTEVKPENEEEELSFNYQELPIDDKTSLRSLISTLDPLSTSSTGEGIDSHSIISIIYVLVGIFIFCSVNSNKEILPVRQIKRELEISDGEDENTIKRAKEDVKFTHSYCKSPNHLEERLEAMTVKKDFFREKLKTATKRVKRLTQKVQSMKRILSNLKKKNLLDKEAITLLNETDSLDE